MVVPPIVSDSIFTNLHFSSARLTRALYSLGFCGLTIPEKNDSLIRYAIGNAEELFGWASPRNISMFLYGSETRCQLTVDSISKWRVYGPLGKQVNDQIVSETGRPTLSIMWPRSLEITHFNPSRAIDVLLDRLNESQCGIDEEDTIRRSVRLTEDAFWNTFLKRPGMYGLERGWDLYCYLLGMTHGGDWLEVPKLLSAELAFNQIRQRSVKAYGSEFGAFRIYNEPTRLLEWVNLLDTGDSSR